MLQMSVVLDQIDGFGLFSKCVRSLVTWLWLVVMACSLDLSKIIRNKGIKLGV